MAIKYSVEADHGNHDFPIDRIIITPPLSTVNQLRGFPQERSVKHLKNGFRKLSEKIYSKHNLQGNT